jgi:hypothetical protein
MIGVHPRYVGVEEGEGPRANLRSLVVHLQCRRSRGYQCTTHLCQTLRKVTL